MTTSYAEMIRQMLEKAPSWKAGADAHEPVRVDMGAVLAEALAGRKVVLPTIDPRTIQTSVPDRLGHHRLGYGPLLMHCLLRAGRLQPELMSCEEAAGLIDVVVKKLAGVSWPISAWPASAGARAGGAMLDAAALIEAGRSSSNTHWTRVGREAVSWFIALQRPSGAWLTATASDNPETHWFDELVILHALANAWAATGDAEIGAAVERNAMWHLAETQPDHATNQPWGLAAFILVPAANSLADQMLHTAMIREADRNAGLTWLLLADTLYSLRLAEDPDRVWPGS